MAIHDKAIDMGLEVHLITAAAEPNVKGSQFELVWLLVRMTLRGLIKSQGIVICCSKGAWFSKGRDEPLQEPHLVDAT